ncbi:MAG: SEC-C domain-containing protein [Chitinispirillaceae bacterium]|jgi:hypothetical protein|nr:SEC-C domain-containing protein [Chitinispirillaceae bacterium]
MTTDFGSLLDEYLGSQHYRLSNAGADAETVLSAFASICASGDIKPDGLTIATLETALSRIAQLDMPVNIRRSGTSHLKSFFGYLAESGRYPAAAAWLPWVDALDKKYQAGFREDGSVRGETFKKNYTDVNRNDPCPCGSGKKFKKCCMGLLD